MALVGPITIQGSTGSSLWAFKTVVTETAVDTAKKTSTVKVECFLGRTNSTSYFGGWYTLKIEIAGQTYTERLEKYAYDIKAGSYVSLGSHTFTIVQGTTPLTVNVKGSYSDAGFNPSSASASGQVTLSKLHEAPTVFLDEVVEKNSILTSYGVSGTTFVPYLSIKEFHISATPYDDATITGYKVNNSTKIYPEQATSPITIDLTQNELLWGYDSESNLPVCAWHIFAYDSEGSRGGILWRENTVIPYIKPNLIATASNIKRNGQISGKVNLNLTGTFYNDKIGSRSNDIGIIYKYWKKGETEPEAYIEVPTNVVEFDGNNFFIKEWNVAKNGTVIEDVGKESIYIFKIKAIDAFGSISNEIELTCSKGEWLMAKFKDRVDFKKITQQGEELARIEKITSEEFATDIFIGDKRVYKKLFTGTLPSTAGSPVDLFTYDFDCSQVWIDESLSFYYNDAETLGVNWFYTTTDYVRTVIRKTNKKIRYKSGGDLSSFYYNIVLAYTKD